MRDLLASVGYASWVLDALILIPVLGCAAVLAARARDLPAGLGQLIGPDPRRNHRTKAANNRKGRTP